MGRACPRNCKQPGVAEPASLRGWSGQGALRGTRSGVGAVDHVGTPRPLKDFGLRLREMGEPLQCCD